MTYVDTQSAGLISVYLIFRAITNPVIGSRYRSRPTARQYSHELMEYNPMNVSAS